MSLDGQHRISESALLEAVGRLRGDAQGPPVASIVLPVNASTDLPAAERLIAELAAYRGPHRLEVVGVINNFDVLSPPPEIHAWKAAGITVVSTPSAWKAGEIVCFSARAAGIAAAGAPYVVAFDADVRVSDPTALLNWYVKRLSDGAGAAYTHTGYYALLPRASVYAKVAVHHVARSIKRIGFRVPVTRGGNYAVCRGAFLDLYSRGLLADELNVGPTMRWCGLDVAYSRGRDLRVLTSGRRFKGGWLKMLRYFPYRLAYNIRMIPVRRNDDRHAYHRQNIRPSRPIIDPHRDG